MIYADEVETAFKAGFMACMDISTKREKIIKETSTMIDKVYEYSSVGSNCHIVISDGNISDEAIKCCQQLLEENVHCATPEQLDMERKILSNLLLLSEEEREWLV